MIFSKRIAAVSILTSMLLLSACEQTSDDETLNEPDQEEVEQNEESLTSDEVDESIEETSSEDTGESDSNETDDDTSTQSDNEEPQLDLKDDVLEPSSVAVLVNKQYSLPEDYVPSDLVTVEVPTVLPNPEIKQMRIEAADALKDMFEAAEESGIILHARSGYGSYQTQVQLFQNYTESHGEEAANKYSARAGESEHQTGLVMDVTSESVNLQISTEFGETEEGQWVSEHAHDYGFIIRYPEGKTDVTGYIYEPWHIRYLGVDLATEVHESGLTYEEYLIDRGMEIEI